MNSKSWEVEIVHETFLYEIREASKVVGLEYFPHHHILVSLSHGGVRCYDTNSFQMIGNIVLEDCSTPNEMIKWNDNTVLCCFESGRVSSFSVEKPFRKLKVFQQNELLPLLEEENFRKAACRVMKVKNEDSFVVVNRNHNFFHIDYNQNEIIREMKSYKVGYTAKLVWSNMYDGCFYYLTDYQDQYLIRLIDFKTEIVKKKFGNHDKVVDMKLVKNRFEEELIIACGGDYDRINDKESFCIFVYNTKTEKRIHCEENLVAEPNRILMIDSQNFILAEYYLFTRLSCLQFLHFENNNYTESSISKYNAKNHEFKTHQIADFQLLSMPEFGRCARISICSEDFPTKILKIENLKLEVSSEMKNAEKDLYDRIQFLQDHLICQSKNERKMFFEILITPNKKKISPILKMIC